jgi:agmatinase
MKRNFGGIEDKYAQLETAKILLQSIPYDGTSTWGKGADNGFDAFLNAAENMELYDIETDSEVYKKGIYILESITEDSSPEAVFEAVYNNCKKLLQLENKFFSFFGGEHSISIGIIKAFYEKYPDISILQLDAHADLRKSYLGSKYNHACAVHDANQNANLVQVGIRSMDSCELEYLKKDNCFFAQDIHKNADWMQKSIDKLNEKVYLTIDLDVFDPSIMPATGTPEPGGLLYNDTISYLKMVFQQRDVVGLDIVELAPIAGLKYPEFMVSKLYYKLLSYKFMNDGK